MATKKEQPHRRKGQIVAARRDQLGLTQPQLAEATKRSLRTIQATEAGETWGRATVARIMERLNMTDEDFDEGPRSTPAEAHQLGRQIADARLWAGFPDDVQVTLLIVGKWLNQYDPLRRFTETDRLADYMRAREHAGSEDV